MGGKRTGALVEVQVRLPT
jgi:hypothetical protein